MQQATSTERSRHASLTNSNHAVSGKDTYKRLLRYVIPYRRQFIIAIIGMVGYAVTDTAFAALMQPMLDGSFVNPSTIRNW